MRRRAGAPARRQGPQHRLQAGAAFGTAPLPPPPRRLQGSDRRRGSGRGALRGPHLASKRRRCRSQAGPGRSLPPRRPSRTRSGLGASSRRTAGRRRPGPLPAALQSLESPVLRSAQGTLRVCGGVGEGGGGQRGRHRPAACRGVCRGASRGCRRAPSSRSRHARRAGSQPEPCQGTPPPGRRRPPGQTCGALDKGPGGPRHGNRRAWQGEQLAILVLQHGAGAVAAALHVGSMTMGGSMGARERGDMPAVAGSPAQAAHPVCGAGALGSLAEWLWPRAGAVADAHWRRLSSSPPRPRTSRAGRGSEGRKWRPAQAGRA